LSFAYHPGACCTHFAGQFGPGLSPAVAAAAAAAAAVTPTSRGGRRLVADAPLLPPPVPLRQAGGPRGEPRAGGWPERPDQRAHHAVVRAEGGFGAAGQWWHLSLLMSAGSGGWRGPTLPWAPPLAAAIMCLCCSHTALSFLPFLPLRLLSLLSRARTAALYITATERTLLYLCAAHPTQAR